MLTAAEMFQWSLFGVVIALALLLAVVINDILEGSRTLELLLLLPLTLLFLAWGLFPFVWG